MIADDKNLSHLYASFARDMFATIAQTMGWEKKEEEKHTDALLRSLALFGYGTYGDTKTIAKAQSMFTEFIKNRKSN